MKFVEVRNDSGKQLSIPAIRGLSFLPGEVKKVTPATVKHPAVSSHIGRGLTLVTSSQGEEPKAPIPTAAVPAAKPVAAPAPVPAAVPAAPAAEPTPAPEPPVMESQKETAGNLQEAYLAAPGISEENVQAILSAFPTLEALANAPVSAVQDASGLSKSACRRLQTWAASQ
jgi:hypothetical protein